MGRDTLGWRPLREIFGDNVVLPIDCILGPAQKVEMEEVYERMGGQPLHWNVGELRKIREAPPQSTRSGWMACLGCFGRSGRG